MISSDRQRDIIRSLIDIYRHTEYMPDARSGNDNGRTLLLHILLCLFGTDKRYANLCLDKPRHGLGSSRTSTIRSVVPAHAAITGNTVSMRIVEPRPELE